MLSKQVHIISSEMIKPSSPTPPHLQTFKFSLLNQLIRAEPTPVHLFFQPPNTPPLRHLKRSLALVLTRFHPLAGTVTDNTHIDCNDRGAIYYEARVNSPMTHFLDPHHISNALKLLTPALEHQAILAVQVTTFSCGCIAICASISHKIADAAAFATFFNCWGAVARGAADDRIKGCVLDSCHVFPPLDPSSLGEASKASPNAAQESLLAMKRFVFTPRIISILQEKLSTEGMNYRPSRVLALAALIWGSYIRVTQQRNDPSTRIKHVATHAIDLRGRIEPKLPGDCLNNLIESTGGIEWPSSTPVDFARIAMLMKGDITKYDDAEYVKRIHVDGTLIDRRSTLALRCARGEVEWFKFTSNCRVPYYEADFGWGPPCWVVSAVVPIDKFCVFVDAPPTSGRGVEAWIVLVREDMEMLERDPFFMEFVDSGRQWINHQPKL